MPLTNFAGSVAIITGGASGIGLATASAAHARGAHVVLADINTEGLLKAKEEIRQHNPDAQGQILTVTTDVTNEQQVRELMRQAFDVDRHIDLVVTSAAWAHAEMTPAVVLSKHLQEFGLLVPTEKESATTTSIELTVPSGFAIDSFVPSPGWKRTEQTKGSGEEAIVQMVTWTGGKVPTGEDAAFHFLATPNDSKTYDFEVRQTYSDGSIVDWSGPESSDTPAPLVDGVSSFGGGGTTTLTIVALIIGAVGVLLGIAGLATRGRPLA